MASPHKNFDPLVVRREYWRREGNVRETAKALGTSRETVYANLRRADALCPAVLPTVNLRPAPDTTPEDADALAAYVRACLDRVGVKKA